MSDQALARIIREVLAEEIGKIRISSGASFVSDQRVIIRCDDDLNAFARKVLEIGTDPVRRKAIEHGELVFRLDSLADQTTRSTAPQSEMGPKRLFDNGILTERHVNQLPKDMVRVALGRKVRVTPLAGDRLRQRGITIERVEQ